MCPEPRGALNLWAGRGAQIPSKSPPPQPLVGRRRRATVTFGPEWLRVARTDCSPRGLGTSLVTAWPRAGPSYAGRAMPARGAGAAARTVWGTCIRRAATHATGEGHTHWHRVWRGYTGPWGSRNPLQKSSSHLSPGKRCEATAQSALGWYRPSVGVPETFGGYRSSGVLRLTIFSSGVPTYLLVVAPRAPVGPLDGLCGCSRARNMIPGVQFTPS